MKNARWTEADLSNVVREARAKFGVPAIAAAAMSSDAVHVQVVEGMRVSGRTDLATLDDYSPIGSYSKSVLAVMVAKLVEQGRIDWQARFFDVLPELTASSDARYRGVTLSDLLLCEAGIRAYTDGKAEPAPEYDASAADHRLEFLPESDFAFTILANAGSGAGTMRAIDWLTARIFKKQFDWWWKFWL